MVANGLAGPCPDVVGIANSVGALWLVGGGAWLVCVVVCSGCLGGYLFYWLVSRQMLKGAVLIFSVLHLSVLQYRS